MTNDALFLQSMNQNGYDPPAIVADAKLHRFAANGKARDLAAWYVLYTDGPIMAGSYGDWRSGQKFTWSAKGEAEMDSAELAAFRKSMNEARRLRDAERKRDQESAQKRAASIWQKAQLAGDDHRYLETKGISSHGLRIHKGSLVAPLADSSGQITTLQFIYADGEKRYLKDGRKAGSYYEIPGKGETIYLAEGYAKGVAQKTLRGQWRRVPQSAVLSANAD